MSPPAKASSVAADEFCATLDDLNTTEQQVGLDHELAAVRADLDRSSAKAQEIFAGGVPAGSDLGTVIGRLAGDLRSISGWVDTGASQADLDADRMPAGVRTSVNDLGFRFHQLEQWSSANCKQQAGDGG